MNKTWLVLRQEIISTITRPSYLFALIGVPVIGTLIFFIAGQFSKGYTWQNALGQLMSSPQTVEAEGYVDHSGIIKEIPASLPAGVLVVFPDETSALQALKQGEISAYYIIPVDYIQRGEITSVRPDLNIIGGSDKANLLEWVLNANLLGDPQLAALANGPTQVEKISLSTAPQREESNMLTYFLPYGVTMMFYFIILSCATLMLNSITKEKQNRVIEILMVSVTPRQLLTGKIVGLGMVGLLQTIIWVGTARFLLARGETTFNLSAAFRLPPSFIAWGLVFFLLGYAVYASLMAGLGSLVPNLREASQATILVIFPLIIPLFLINVLIEEPHSTISVILSIFPLTSPVAMMTRLASGGVPVWQVLLSATLLAVTSVLVVRSVARMFHAQSILSGQPFNRKMFLNALVGRS